MNKDIVYREYPGKDLMKGHQTFERRSAPGKETRHTRDPTEQVRLDREFDQYSDVDKKDLPKDIDKKGLLKDGDKKGFPKDVDKQGVPTKDLLRKDVPKKGSYLKGLFKKRPSQKHGMPIQPRPTGRRRPPAAQESEAEDEFESEEEEEEEEEEAAPPMRAAPPPPKRVPIAPPRPSGK